VDINQKRERHEEGGKQKFKNSNIQREVSKRDKTFWGFALRTVTLVSAKSTQRQSFISLLEDTKISSNLKSWSSLPLIRYLNPVNKELVNYFPISI